VQSTDIPLKLPIPFGADAGGGFIRAIPVASQIGVTDGAASLTDGFVPLNAQPIASGGVPPDIKDMNGILFEISGWSRWLAAGGPVYFDAGFATDIGGYPLGASIQSAITPGVMFVSTVENNMSNPDSGGANWISLSPVPATLAELIAGVNTTKFATAATLAGLRATTAEVISGVSVAKYISPAALAGIRASGAEVRAGTDVAKYISPATLAGAFLEFASGAAVTSGNTNIWFSMPVNGLAAPIIVQMGKVVDGGSNPIFCAFPKAFTTAVLGCGGIPFTNSTGGFSDQDGFIGVAGAPGLNSLLFAVSRRGGDQPVAGCYWWAIGY
jgi:hypothetical protein